MNVLIACEESQTVCASFRKLGFNAYSCDLVECSGGHPEWHLLGDALDVIKNNGGITQDGNLVLVDKWHLMIAHPPCTYLTSSGAKWYYHPEDKHLPIEDRRPHPKFPNRKQDQEDGANFFMALMNANIDYIAVENPVGVMSTRYRKPDQIVQPFMFGNSARKTTCLWLKGLPPLEATELVSQGESIVFRSGKKMPKWYCDALTNAKTDAERRKLRSKTFDGIAQAMAQQWGEFVLQQEKINEKSN
jgi:hypothetical protein